MKKKINDVIYLRMEGVCIRPCHLQLARYPIPHMAFTTSSSLAQNVIFGVVYLPTEKSSDLVCG